MGKFAEKVAEVLDGSGGTDWKARLAQQQARMGTHVVSSQEEAMARAKELLAQLKDRAYQTGFGIRSQQHSHGNVEQLLDRDENTLGVPGREHMIEFPTKAAGVGSVLGAVVHKLGPAGVGAVGLGSIGALNGATLPESQRHGKSRTFSAATGGAAGALFGGLAGRELSALGRYDTKKSVIDAVVGQLKARRAKITGSPVLKQVGAADWTKGAEWFEPHLLSKEALMGFVTDPLKNKYEDMMVNLRNSMNEKRLHGMRITSDPMTIPSFAPSVALSVPKSFVSGYQAADKAQAERLHGEMDQKLEKARQEFDNALKDEYSASHQKAASAGEFIDGLAQWWTKQADGEINRALGLYLAAAGLLGAGGHAAAKSVWQKHDPRYQRLKAMQDMIKLRQRHTQLPVLVTEEHLPEEADETPLMGPPGELGTESNMEGAANSAIKVGAPIDLSVLSDLVGNVMEHANIMGGYRHLPGMYARSAKQAVGDAIKPVLAAGSAAPEKAALQVGAKPAMRGPKPLRISYNDAARRVSNINKDASVKNVVSYAANEGAGRLVDHIGTKLSRHRKKHHSV